MPADWKPSLPYPPQKINYPVTSGQRRWISVWQTRDNLYKNCGLQTSTRPWWFYFCQIRFPTLPLKEFAFSGAKEHVSPYCWELVNWATNTSKGRPLPQVRHMRGTEIVPTFGYSPRWLFLATVFAASKSSTWATSARQWGDTHPQHLLSPLRYLLCGIGDEKTQEKEKVMGEIHQRANKPNVQRTSETNRNECSNAGGSRAEHTEREENNKQGM